MHTHKKESSDVVALLYLSVCFIGTISLIPLIVNMGLQSLSLTKVQIEEGENEEVGVFVCHGWCPCGTSVI